MAARRARPVSSSKMPVAAVVLAAGQGTRMRSARVKVLHELLGRPLITYAVELARAVGADPIVLTLGPQRDLVEAAVRAHLGPDAARVRVALQARPRGTGHAVRMALPALAGFDGVVAILSGDVPLVRRETLAALVGEVAKYRCLGMVTATPAVATGYGRVVRDARGSVVRVVEHRDATDEEREIGEVNAGLYAAPAAWLRQAVAQLPRGNAQGEEYLTDIISRAAQGPGVLTVEAAAEDFHGINDRAQLAAAEATLGRRIVDRWSAHATFRDPATAVVEPGVTVDPDAEIGRGVALRGRTHVRHGARVDDGCILTDTDVGAGATLRPYTVASGATIGAHAIVGPFAHLRPGTELGQDVHVGNFVEIKKASLGRGSKTNHLSYLGDAVIGARVNVGAGTITCNYNGYEKRVTVIEDDAHIGSDTQLVAPVKVGRRAVVGAGTTVVKDVPAGALALSRPDQIVVAGYAARLAQRYGKAKTSQRRARRKETS